MDVEVVRQLALSRQAPDFVPLHSTTSCIEKISKETTQNFVRILTTITTSREKHGKHVDISKITTRTTTTGKSLVVLDQGQQTKLIIKQHKHQARFNFEKDKTPKAVIVQGLGHSSVSVDAACRSNFNQAQEQPRERKISPLQGRSDYQADTTHSNPRLCASMKDLPKKNKSIDIINESILRDGHILDNECPLASPGTIVGGFRVTEIEYCTPFYSQHASESDSKNGDHGRNRYMYVPETSRSSTSQLCTYPKQRSSTILDLQPIWDIGELKFERKPRKRITCYRDYINIE